MSSTVTRLELGYESCSDEREGTLSRIGKQLWHWLQVARERQQLEALSEEALMDIGVGPAEARAEYQRRFWDAPPCR